MSNAHDDIVVPPRPPLPATTTVATPTTARALLRSPRAWLVAYAVILATIAFWPTPVDQGAGALLRAITRIIPVLTYERIEFLANIVMFVPLGLLLTLIITSNRWLVLPIAFLTTVAVESVQAVALAARTPSILDIIANTAGACLGMLLAVFIETLARSRAPLNKK